MISAVGHEIDVTLADLAADVRALTPSEAAELVAPAAEELVAQLRQIERRLASGLHRRAESARARLDALARHTAFRRPYQRVFELGRQLDEWGRPRVESRARLCAVGPTADRRDGRPLGTRLARWPCWGEDTV